MINILETKRREGLRFKGRANLGNLNPMAIPLHPLHPRGVRGNLSQCFIGASIEVTNNQPRLLIEKWIATLNDWVDGIISVTMVDVPDIIFD